MVMGELTLETEVLVIGGGPGGYAAAFRAADLGLDVTMVNMEARPGGVCLFRGCIPSKTLLYLSEMLYDARRASAMGISFREPEIDIEKIRAWKQTVIDKLADGLVRLNNKRGVQLIQGQAVFENSRTVRLHDADVSSIKFKQAIIATGSHPTPLPDVPFQSGSHIMSSAGALDLQDIPSTLLILGGGYVALELGSVYAALGSRVTLAVRGDRLLRGADADLAAPLIDRVTEIFDAVWYHTTVSSLKETDQGVSVEFKDAPEKPHDHFDRVLVAIGRLPNTKDIGLENTAVETDRHGFIKVDDRQRTSETHIFAVGDVIGGMMLAHKATREGKIAAEVIAGQPSAFDIQAIPAVVYTDPQIAWCGLTEEEARRQNRRIRVERFPWKFSGRATTMDVPEGITKMIIEPDTGRILGVGIVGRHTEGLISEGVLAIEMGALAEDLALSIHPHPTLSETVSETTEIFLGSATHILPRKS
jgi:dihydrolipoamide dehydrogenase